MAVPRTPLLTVDIIIEKPNVPGHIVLIERKHAPVGWALPGGFVDVGETVAMAARREAKEETQLDVHIRDLLGVYSDPTRDTRGHTVSVVFCAYAEGEPHAGDDAGKAAWHALDHLPLLVFDHATVLRDYMRWRNSGEKPSVER